MGDLIFEQELALLHATQQQFVMSRCVRQDADGEIKVAMFEEELLYSALQFVSAGFHKPIYHSTSVNR